jgi:hypothetical protein
MFALDNDMQEAVAVVQWFWHWFMEFVADGLH